MARKVSAKAQDVEALDTPEVRQTIVIPEFQQHKIRLHIKGETPLICHAWSKKAMQMILEAQQGVEPLPDIQDRTDDKPAKGGKKPKKKLPPKVPEDDFRDSLYVYPDGGYGFPAGALKCAAVDACSGLTGLSPYKVRGFFHVVADGESVAFSTPLVRIQGEPVMRSDMVIIPTTRNADIRFRAEFKQWRMSFDVRFNPRVVKGSDIAALFADAGFSVGLGDWRVVKRGQFGMFRLDPGGNDGE